MPYSLPEFPIYSLEKLTSKNEEAYDIIIICYFQKINVII